MDMLLGAYMKTFLGKKPRKYTKYIKKEIETDGLEENQRNNMRQKRNS